MTGGVGGEDAGEVPRFREARDAMPTELAEPIRLVVFDVDGVLTDASVYLGHGPDGEAVELKRFDIQDGLALKLLRAAGVEVALVSGRVSTATALRARELGILECHQDDGARKLPVVREIAKRLGVGWSEIAMVGDDLPDLPVMERVGLPVAVANAVPEVRRRARWATGREGGRGAVREFVRAFLLARGEWDRIVEDYCAARSDD
jgi:3-deoxy-D-manno-octulosonate 8-phosphate phosphatase (KDO 8-P phosphatase)